MQKQNIPLLNINEIHTVRQNNPEPNEISATRNLIQDSFKDLIFVEDVHKYFLPQTDGNRIELPSVSATIERWSQEVDWNEKAEQKALRCGIKTEELLKQWHESNIISTHNGSKTHFFGENTMNMLIGKEEETKRNLPFQYSSDGYLIPYCGKERAIINYYRDILYNPDVFPVMPEAKIYTNYNNTFHFKQPYAGTFDILLAYKYKNRYVYSIHDFKTNASLYKDYAHDHHIMMLPPFDKLGLYEEAFAHYCIQLSLYQIGLMQLGIEIVDRNIIWLKDDGTYEKIKTPDLTSILIRELT